MVSNQAHLRSLGNDTSYSSVVLNFSQFCVHFENRWYCLEIGALLNLWIAATRTNFKTAALEEIMQLPNFPHFYYCVYYKGSGKLVSVYSVGINNLTDAEYFDICRTFSKTTLLCLGNRSVVEFSSFAGKRWEVECM